MVGRHDKVFFLKGICVHLKGKNNNFLVKRQHLELVGHLGKETASYPEHRILGTFRGEVSKEISASLL